MTTVLVGSGEFAVSVGRHGAPSRGLGWQLEHDFFPDKLARAPDPPATPSILSNQQAANGNILVDLIPVDTDTRTD